MTDPRPALPTFPELPGLLPDGVELRPALGPNGWPEIRYPVGDVVLFRASLDAANRRVHIHATHRPWTADDLANLALILATLSDWLREQSPL